MTIFLVIDHKFRISPFFSCFSTFPPCFAKIIISPLLLKISVPHLKFLGDRLPQSLPVLQKFTCFLHTLCVFRFPPYFDHDAFMHHPMHLGLLDAPENFPGEMLGWRNVQGKCPDTKFIDTFYVLITTLAKLLQIWNCNSIKKRVTVLMWLESNAFVRNNILHAGIQAV